MSHTPGKWEAAVGTSGFHILADGRGIVCSGGNAGDADLIASAPDLLAALKEIVRGDTYGTYSGSQCVEIAQAAIARAEGK